MLGHDDSVVGVRLLTDDGMNPLLKASKLQTPASDFKLNCKSRQQLILKEGKQLTAVLEHPAFQADPLAAIHQHLRNTQPVVDKKPKKKANKNGGKKKKSKGSSISQSMSSHLCDSCYMLNEKW
ncbi:hypothetical protein GQ457_03G003250 [Hibiscus cannabinus]